MSITVTILLAVVALAQIANLTIPYNYMFLERHDGTPYSIFYNMVNGNLILYKILVIGGFALLIGVFYLYRFLRERVRERNKKVSYA